MIRPSKEGRILALDPNKFEQMERFRGWSLTALYFAIALWGIVFCFATYHFWPFLLEQAGGNNFQATALAILSVTTFLLSARTGQRFLDVMRRRAPLPRVDLLPFLAIAATIVVAGRAFGPA